MSKNLISAEDYKKIVENVPICCVDMVIHNNGKILLMKRENEPVKGAWWIPGGRLLKNEKFDDAVLRKSCEETGLKVKIIRKLGVYETMFDIARLEGVKSGTHTINIGFLVEPNDSVTIKLDGQSSKYKWTNKIDEELHPYVKELIQDSEVLDNVS